MRKFWVEERWPNNYAFKNDFVPKSGATLIPVVETRGVIKELEDLKEAVRYSDPRTAVSMLNTLILKLEDEGGSK